MSRTVTAVITCDRCGDVTVHTYTEHAELDFTSTVPFNSIGRPRDICQKCMVFLLRERADQIEQGKR